MACRKLSYNRMYGTIPEGVSRMTALRAFEFANNYVVGPIPSTVRSMRSLRSIDFTRNRLRGPIPTDLAACSFLERLCAHPTPNAPSPCLSPAPGFHSRP